MACAMRYGNDALRRCNPNVSRPKSFLCCRLETIRPFYNMWQCIHLRWTHNDQTSSLHWYLPISVYHKCQFAGHVTDQLMSLSLNNWMNGMRSTLCFRSAVPVLWLVPRRLSCYVCGTGRCFSPGLHLLFILTNDTVSRHCGWSIGCQSVRMYVFWWVEHIIWANERVATYEMIQLQVGSFNSPGTWMSM
jgi:hypothetical protein